MLGSDSVKVNVLRSYEGFIKAFLGCREHGDHSLHSKSSLQNARGQISGQEGGAGLDAGIYYRTWLSSLMIS